MVSRKLVEDLSGLGEFVVARLPASLDKRIYLPAHSRVLASLGETTLIASSLPPTQLFAEWQREMPKLGWKLLLEARPDWGLVSPAAPVIESGLVLCGHERWLTVLLVPAAEGSRLRVSAQKGMGDCEGIGVWTAGRFGLPSNPDETVPMRLVNPATVRAEAHDICPYNSGVNAAQSVVQATMSVDSLMTHYGRQLEERGWKPGAPAGLIRSWMLTDSTGKLRQIDLRVSSRPDAPDCRDLFYHIRTVKR